MKKLSYILSDIHETFDVRKSVHHHTIQIKQRFRPFLPKVEPEAPSAVACSWWWAGWRPKHVEPHMNVE